VRELISLKFIPTVGNDSLNFRLFSGQSNFYSL